METEYIVVFVLFGVAVLVVFFKDQLARLLRIKRPERMVQFAGTISLTWRNHFWEGKAVLPSWAGFQKRLGPYASISGAEPSSGEVQLSVSSPDTEKPAAPSEAQEKGFRHVLENNGRMRDMVLKAISDVYPKLRESYKEFLGDELEKRMPELNNPSDLKSLIGLSTVHVLSIEKDGMAYVGFEFGCEWEEEHGLGVMSHGDRIIDVGSAEEAFSDNIANEDKSNG